MLSDKMRIKPSAAGSIHTLDAGFLVGCGAPVSLADMHSEVEQFCLDSMVYRAGLPRGR